MTCCWLNLSHQLNNGFEGEHESIIGTEKGKELDLARQVQCNDTVPPAWRHLASNESADTVLGWRTMWGENRGIWSLTVRNIKDCGGEDRLVKMCFFFFLSYIAYFSFCFVKSGSNIRFRTSQTSAWANTEAVI